MLFALTCLDKPDALETRLATRPAHIDYIRALGDKVKMGGPLIAEDGETMCGSLILIDADSRAEIEEIAANDPYAKAGVFESVSIQGYKWVINAPENL